MGLTKKKGLIEVLLSEETENEHIALSDNFFDNYFNGECEPYINYLSKNKIFDTDEELFQYIYDKKSICENEIMVFLNKNNYEVLHNIILDNLSYHTQGQIILDEDDLKKLFREEFVSEILSDFGLNIDTYFDVDIEDIKHIMNEEELEMLEKNPDLEQNILNVYVNAYNDAMTDEIYENVIKGLKYFFQTEDVNIEENKRGDRFLLIDGSKFLKKAIKDLLDELGEDYITEIFECGTVICIIEKLFDYDNEYEKISTHFSSSYYYPDERKIKKNFHELFNDFI
jgi:hypothetical protein